MRHFASLVLIIAIIVLVAAPVSAAPIPEQDKNSVERPADTDEKKPLGQLVELTDIEAYKFLVLATRTFWTASPNYKAEPWKDEALGFVVSWMEFIERYPKSPLVSHAYLRMADWYLTIKKGDDRADWTQRERQRNADPDEIKNNPGVLDPVYAAEALALINRVLKRFPNDPYLANVAEGEFEWNDKVGAVALYMRGLIFREYCKKDLARLRRDYPNSPLTRDAQRHFAKSCFR